MWNPATVGMFTGVWECLRAEPISTEEVVDKGDRNVIVKIDGKLN